MLHHFEASWLHYGCMQLLKDKIIECSNLELNAKGNPISIEIKADCEPLQKKSKRNN